MHNPVSIKNITVWSAQHRNITIVSWIALVVAAGLVTLTYINSAITTDLGFTNEPESVVAADLIRDSGIEMDLDLVPVREESMTPYEIMLSESQERMLLFSEPKHLPKLTSIFKKWGLQITEIGKVTDTGNVRISNHGHIDCDVPIKFLTSPPEYRLQAIQPKWIESAHKFNFTTLEIPMATPSSILEKILSSPNIASKESVFQQYDHQIQTNTVLNPGHDAAVLRIKGTTRAIALTTDGNGRYCWLDPFEGGKIAVAEACRNLSCSGAQPIAMSKMVSVNISPVNRNKSKLFVTPGKMVFIVI